MQALLSSQLVSQLPSQSSPASTKLFWQIGTQSLSLRLLQPGAQQLSLLVQLIMSTLLQRALQVVAEPFRESTVQLLESSHAVGQFPSQISVVSTIEFPQVALQSLSLLLLQPGAQHPSAFPQTVMSEKTQTALQLFALPLREFVVQASPSSHVDGQFPSQVSPASTTLLEQTGAQSSSLRLLHPVAQHPSAGVQVMISLKEQTASQVLEEPLKLSTVQAFWSEQLAGQSPSQSSPVSSRELPHTGWQSLSVTELQPGGQHPSLPVHAQIAELEHWKSQVASLPLDVSTVQALLSSQLVAQLPSQSSPASTKLFWQTGSQSVSLRLLQPNAQQPSPLVQLVFAILLQTALQVVAEPLRESTVQTLESKHEVGQLPSQDSFASTIEFPQAAVQSSSLLLLQPAGQQPSPFAQEVMSSKTQTALQSFELPLRESVVQASASSHEAGQFPSQDSPASTMLLEQTGAHSSSLRLLHPAAQQPSPEVQVMISV